MPESTTTDPVPVKIESGQVYLVQVNGGTLDVHNTQVAGSPFLEGTIADGERYELSLASVDDSNGEIPITLTASATTGCFWGITKKL